MYKNNFVAVIKHKGKILREAGGEVSLPFGSQYSILLKNENSRQALVSIEVDGEDVLAGKSLIIDENSSQEIKGFMRDMSVTNRFKFIHKTKEISVYRGNKLEDGLVTIRYTFEKEKTQPITIINKRTCPNPDPYPITWPCYPDKYTYSCIDYTYRVPIGDVSCSNNSNAVLGSVTKLQNYLEDGITVKGSKINQQYQYGNIGELENQSYVIVLQLKGQTKHKKNIIKPVTVKTKLRCSTCGRRSNSSSKFCYNCGTYLEAN